MRPTANPSLFTQFASARLATSSFSRSSSLLKLLTDVDITTRRRYRKNVGKFASARLGATIASSLRRIVSRRRERVIIPLGIHACQK